LSLCDEILEKLIPSVVIAATHHLQEGAKRARVDLVGGGPLLEVVGGSEIIQVRISSISLKGGFMPTKKKIDFIQGGYYHLYNRGAGRTNIFIDDQDFVDFLMRLKEYMKNFQVQMIAYCLMPNHFHLLVRQEGTIKAGLAVQYTCNGYVQRFNLRHDRQGALFQGSYDGGHVDNDIYLRHLCRYIHGNPVKDGFVSRPKLWPYSNYQEWRGQRNGRLVDREFIDAHFGSHQAYTSYLIDYLAGKTLLPPELQIYLNQLA
jgi:putative transposase